MRILLVITALLLSGCSAYSASTPASIRMPLSDVWMRPTPLRFGLYVTPDPNHNPISPPERFEGYHAALDFEILPNERYKNVPAYAICDGEVLVSNFAEGYGGVLVQSCAIDGEDVTVLYGHLEQASMKAVGTDLKRGQRIAFLGEARSEDADGNRKHLHLSIHKGKDVEMLGYVQSEAALNNFLDPAAVLGLPTYNWPSSASGKPKFRVYEP